MNLFGCLNRYVFKSWLVTFMGILLLVTSIFLLQKILVWLPRLIENDVPLVLALQLFTNLIPGILLLVIPIAYFFGLYRLVKQLQSSSELDAMYAGGLSLFNIFKPILLVGVLLSICLFWMNMLVIPDSKIKIYNTAAQLSALRSAPSFIPAQFSDVEGITFYSEGKKPDGMYSMVMISDAREHDNAPIVYFAKLASINTSDSGLFIQLFDGTQLSGMQGNLKSVYFKEYLIQIPMVFEHGFSKMNKESDYAYMDGMTLYQHMQQHGHARSISEWQKRWIPSISILVLFFLAIPLALQAKRSNKGGSFLLALAVVALIEQIQLVTHRKIGLEVMPWWSTWAIEACYIAIALWLFFTVNKYGNLSFKHMRTTLSFTSH